MVMLLEAVALLWLLASEMLKSAKTEQPRILAASALCRYIEVDPGPWSLQHAVRRLQQYGRKTVSMRLSRPSAEIPTQIAFSIRIGF